MSIKRKTPKIIPAKDGSALVFVEKRGRPFFILKQRFDAIKKAVHTIPAVK
jgi:hypothetical protein